MSNDRDAGECLPAFLALGWLSAGRSGFRHCEVLVDSEKPWGSHTIEDGYPFGTGSGISPSPIPIFAASYRQDSWKSPMTAR